MAFPDPCAERPAIDDMASCHGASPLASPAAAEAAARLAGRPFRPFERVALLECGTGVGLAILAAALAGTGAEITGTTADPDEAAAARALLEEADLEAQVKVARTAELAPEALPELDLVLMPEGWDLLGADARHRMAALLRERLAPGGGFLVMRETPPGARGPQLLRRLIANRFAALGGDAMTGKPRADVAERAIAAAAQMLPICHAALRTQPRWRAELQRLAGLPGALAERHWLTERGPAWSMRELQPWLAEAGLALCAPAEPQRTLRSLDFTPEQLAVIEACDDPGAAGETEELIAGLGQRCDLFLRPGGRSPDLGAQRLRPIAESFDPSLEVHGFLGTSRLSREHHEPVLQTLAELASSAPDGCATLGDVARQLKTGPESLRDPACALIGAKAVVPAPSAPAGPPAQKACRRLNRLLVSRIESRWAGSPVAGGPIALRSTGSSTASADARGLKISAQQRAHMEKWGAPI